MAVNGTIQGTVKNSSGVDISTRYGTWISWQRNSYSIDKSTSNITITVNVQRIDGYTGETAWNLEDKPTVTLTVGGSNKTPTISYIDTRNQNLCTFATWTGDVGHNANGTLNLNISCSWSLSGVSALANGSISGTATLDTIPRYATINQSLKSKTETTITMTWGADVSCDTLQCSINGGSSFIDISGYPNYTITGLSPNTTYNIVTKARRTDSQLYSQTTSFAVTTYDYPHCTSSPDFTIGDALTLDFYNPLSRSIAVTGYAKTDGRKIFEGWTTGTRLVGFNDSNSVNLQYQSIPNSQSGTYKVSVKYGSIEKVRDTGNSYRIRGNEIPTINAFDYIDSNETTVAITGNNQHIVQNQSTLSARFHSATANYGAGGIAQYYLECNGQKANGNQEGQYYLGTIDSARNVGLTLTAVDSRGLSASKTIEVTMLAHSKPTALVELQRLNNYEDETYLTVDASISSVNGKNTMTIQYRYKEKGGSWSSLETIGDREKKILQLDKNKEFDFHIKVQDAFSTYQKFYTLGKGVFPLFIDTRLNSVGVNKLPQYNKSLETWGLISLGERNVIELGVGESINIPIFLALCSGLVNFRVSGANIEVARLFYVFRSNEYFGMHKTLVDESYGNTSQYVAMAMSNTVEGYVFKVTNNYSSAITIRYGILELC